MIEIPYIVLIINGFMSGIGTALGTYLVNRHLFKRLEYLEEKLKGKTNGDKTILENGRGK